MSSPSLSSATSFTLTSMDVESILQDYDRADSSERGTFFATLSSNSDFQMAILQSLLVGDDSARANKSLTTLPYVLEMLLKWYRFLSSSRGGAEQERFRFDEYFKHLKKPFCWEWERS
jgi:hypothetical protein